MGLHDGHFGQPGRGGWWPGLTADARSQDDLERAVREGIVPFGHIDVLMANAGVWGVAPQQSMNEQTWGDMIDIDRTGTGPCGLSRSPWLSSSRPRWS
jgi:NAD(P)-dependent dehydrogenase (short-subunit alcohol dehydrogenase family)